jgi:hypothetical protein
MGTERVAGSRLRCTATKNGNEWISRRKPGRITVGSYRALIADVMDKQDWNLDGSEIESAQAYAGLAGADFDLSK